MVLGGHVDHFKIGMWLEMKGVLKKNKDIRRQWWFTAIICVIIQLYIFFRIISVSFKEVLQKDYYT